MENYTVNRFLEAQAPAAERECDLGIIGGITVAKQASCHRTFGFLLGVFDILALIGSWHATVWVRLVLNPFMSVQLRFAELKGLAPPLSRVLLLWILAAVWLRLYRLRPGSTAGENLLRAVESVVIAGTLTIVAGFFSWHLGARLSRSFVLLFVPVSLIMLIASRYAALLAARVVDKKWVEPERIAVVGAGVHARTVVESIRRTGTDAVTVTGVILPDGATRDDLSNPVPVLGTVSRLAELINRKGLKRIIVVEGCLMKSELDECASVSKRMDVIVSHTIGYLRPDARLELSQLGGLHLLEMRPVGFTRTTEIVKRGFDIVVSVTLLLVFMPLLVLFGLLVKLTSDGPALYKSIRVGKGGRHFRFIKFRSMYQGAEHQRDSAARNEKNGHLFKMWRDPRITPLGRFIRRFSIDELPQLWNVLAGDMSLVGPRPLPAQDLEPDGQSKQFAEWAEHRSRVLPGITGLWQVRGRSDLPFEKMIELDIEYIQNWSLRLDLRLLLETPLILLTGRGAY